MDKLSIKKGIKYATNERQFRQALTPGVALVNKLTEEGKFLEAAGLLGYMQRHGKRFDVLRIEGVNEPVQPEVGLDDPWKGNRAQPEQTQNGAHFTVANLRNLSDSQRAQVTQAGQAGRSLPDAPKHTSQAQETAQRPAQSPQDKDARLNEWFDTIDAVLLDNAGKGRSTAELCNEVLAKMGKPQKRLVRRVVRKTALRTAQPARKTALATATVHPATLRARAIMKRAMASK